MKNLKTRIVNLNKALGLLISESYLNGLYFKLDKKEIVAISEDNLKTFRTVNNGLYERGLFDTNTQRSKFIPFSKLKKKKNHFDLYWNFIDKIQDTIK